MPIKSYRVAGGRETRNAHMLEVGKPETHIWGGGGGGGSE